MVYNFFPKLEHTYLLDENRVGILKFIGETKFSGGTWYGFALIDSVGKHDGQVQGKRYFKTSNHPPRGVFVRRPKILSEVEEESLKKKNKKNKALGRETGQDEPSAIKNWKPAKYEITNGKQEKRREVLDPQYYLNEAGRMRKKGPRQIGKIEGGWEPAVYDTSDSDSLAYKNKEIDAEHFYNEAGRRRKLGPRDIGRVNSQWEPANYSTADKGKFLERMRSLASVYGIEKRDNIDAEHYTTESGKKKKLGPREVGHVTNWEPAKYDVPKTGEFLDKRRYLVPGTKPGEIAPRQKVDTQHYITDTGQKRKLGPREIGRLVNWEPAKYDLPNTGAFLEKRKMSFVRLPGEGSMRSKMGSQQFKTVAHKEAKLGTEEDYITESSTEKSNIPDTENYQEVKEDFVNGEVQSYEQIDVQHGNTGNDSCRVPPVEIGGVRFVEFEENKVPENANIFIEEIPRHSKFEKEQVEDKARDVQHSAGSLHATCNKPEQVKPDREEAQQDELSSSDSVFVEHRQERRQESVNVSPSSEEETTDELRF